MPRGPRPIRQRDVKAVLKGALDAGVDVARVEIDTDGKIKVVIGKPKGTPDSQQEGENQWEHG